MATGRAWQPGAVVAPADVPDAGTYEWSRLTGMQPHDPLMQGGPTMGAGAGSVGPHDPDIGRSRIITQEPGERADGSAPEPFDDWRDLFDYHSPAFWVFALTLAAIGLMQVKVSASGRVGPASAGGGASLG